MIHHTAIIHPQAKLGANVRVGPYAVIDADVELGDGCVVGPHVYLTGATTIGAGNRFHAGAVIGDAPQDLKYKDEPTRVRIGDNNIFREHVTINRSNKLAEDTVIGSNNLFMAGAHVGHNSIVGSHVIMANGSFLAGHVTVQDRAFVSGSCLVHQFCRVGTLAIMQGGSAITQDLPPFTVVSGVNDLCGLNTVGLRRAGYSPEERIELKRLYRALFRSGQNLSEAVAGARKNFSSAGARIMLDFVAAAKRGICAGTRAGRHTAEET
jgi:UDP-N-acetylglucosamine acyltransferase